MKKLLTLIIISLSCGCGFMTFPDPVLPKECVEVTDYPPIIAGITAAEALGIKAYECEDNAFDGEGKFQQWNGMCTINSLGIFMRRFSDQYLCQCAFHEGIHASTSDWYDNGRVPSDVMVQTCKDFSLVLPENPSWMGI